MDMVIGLTIMSIGGLFLFPAWYLLFYKALDFDQTIAEFLRQPAAKPGLICLLIAAVLVIWGGSMI